MIPRPQHRDRVHGQSGQPIAKRPWRLFASQAQQQGDLHVRRLAARRQVHRRGVLVPVHEHQARPAGDVTQRGNGSEQHGAVGAVHERKPARRQRRAHPAVQRVDHLEQCPLVEQARPGGPLSDRAGKHEIWLHDRIRAERRRQSRRPQRLSRPGLARGPPHPVERHPDQVDPCSARRVLGGRGYPHHVLPAIADKPHPGLPRISRKDQRGNPGRRRDRKPRFLALRGFDHLLIGSCSVNWLLADAITAGANRLRSRGTGAMADDILSIYARSQPDKPAVIDDRPDGTVVAWTYAELEAQANRVANLLLSLGAGPGKKVLWCGPNSPQVVAIMSASRKIGAVAVPLNYRLTPEEALYVINHSDAEVAYVDYEHAPMFAALRDRLEKVRHIIAVGGPAPDGMLTDADIAAAPADAPDVGDAAGTGGTMIYTSGTTGKPKGAVRSGAPDPELLGALLGLFAYRPDDIYITSGPLYHSGPSAFMGAGMLFGQTIIVQRKFDAEDWLRLVDKYKASSTFSAPALVRMICALPKEVKERYDRSSMRVMIANAAPWSYALKQQYVADFPPESLFEVYGSTELGVDTVLLPADQMRKPGSCGKPAPGIEIALLDADGNEVTGTGPDHAGEVFVRSKGAFDTYYKNDASFESNSRGDYHTVGDVAYWDDEGYLYICDRKTDMIISGGMNIYPAEIEAADRKSTRLNSSHV